MSQARLPAEAALREFEEETGTRLECVPFPLARIRQAGGKNVEAFAAEGDLDAAKVTSNEFELEWPPRSGQLPALSEVVEARWMTLAEARTMMLKSQLPLARCARDQIEWSELEVAVVGSRRRGREEGDMARQFARSVISWGSRVSRSVCPSGST